MTNLYLLSGRETDELISEIIQHYQYYSPERSD